MITASVIKGLNTKVQQNTHTHCRYNHLSVTLCQFREADRALLEIVGFSDAFLSTSTSKKVNIFIKGNIFNM